MKSLHVLSRVLPLTLLMSIPMQSNAQGAKPLTRDNPSIEIDMHPGDTSFGAAGPAQKRKSFAGNASIESARHPGEMPFRTTGSEHEKHAMETSHLVKKLSTKKELSDAIASHKNVAIKIHKGQHASDTSLAKAVQANHGNVKAYSIDASNPEFVDFIEMFKGRNPEVVLIRREIGARDAQAFNKTLTDLTGLPAALGLITQAQGRFRPAKGEEPKKEYHQYVKEVKTAKELNDALASHKNVTVKVSTPWCGACTMAEEPFAQAIKAHEGHVKAVTFNGDKATEFAKFLDIFKAPGYPTFFYIQTYQGPEDERELKKTMRDFTGSTRIHHELESGQFGSQERPTRRRRKERRQERDFDMPEGQEEMVPSPRRPRRAFSEDEPQFPRRRRARNENSFNEDFQRPMMRPGIDIL